MNDEEQKKKVQNDESGMDFDNKQEEAPVDAVATVNESEDV